MSSALARRVLQVVLGCLLCLPVLPAWAQGPALGRDTLPPPSQPGAFALYAQGLGAPERAETEVWHLAEGQLAVRNVSRPTLQPFLPTGARSGAAVIVAPGGGFRGLAIETEGFAVAKWLASQGIAAFVLKYRVLPTPTSQAEFIDLIAAAVRGSRPDARPPEDTPPEALADGLAALRRVRERAAEFGVDPARVGFMGFSAGGFLARSVVEQGGDQGPDFAIGIYPNMKAMSVPTPAPPLFVLIAQDDFLLRGVTGFPLIDSYRAAGGAVEFHLLPGGGHGFGLGRTGTASEAWPWLLQRWLMLQRLSVAAAPTGR